MNNWLFNYLVSNMKYKTNVQNIFLFALEWIVVVILVNPGEKFAEFAKIVRFPDRKSTILYVKAFILVPMKSGMFVISGKIPALMENAFRTEPDHPVFTANAIPGLRKTGMEIVKMWMNVKMDYVQTEFVWINKGRLNANVLKVRVLFRAVTPLYSPGQNFVSLIWNNLPVQNKNGPKSAGTKLERAKICRYKIQK